jgi:hypothetical protein
MDHTQKTADDRTGERRRKTKTDKISASFSLMSAASFLSAAPPGSYLRSVRMSIGATVSKKESGGDVQS